MLAIAGCLALGVGLVLELRAMQPSSGRRLRLGVGEVIKGLVVRSLIVAGGVAVLALICGFASLLLQHTALSVLGIGTTTAIVRVLAVLLAVCGSPLPVMLLCGFVRSRTGVFRPWNEIASVRAAYLPLLVVTLFAVALGFVTYLACGLITFRIASVTLFGLCGIMLGGLWILFACSICLNGNGVDVYVGLPSFSSTVIRRMRQGLACVLSFVLAFNLLGEPDLSHAVEGVPGYVEPPAPVEQVEGFNSAPETVSAPKPTAEAPHDYYEQAETPEGKLAYIQDDAAIFQTGARTYTTVVGGPAITYMDEDGIARVIDNTLEGHRVGLFSESVEYVNRSNGYTARIPDVLSDSHPIRFEKSGHSMEVIPQGGDFSRSAAEGEAIRYTEVRQGIDYQYTLVGSVVKEDIVLTRAVAPQDLSTKIKFSEGLVPALEDGVVVVRDSNHRQSEDDEEALERATAEADSEDPASGEEDVVFAIAAPLATDAAGEVSDNIQLRLSENEDGTYVVSLDIDWDWIGSPERAYPIRIDPTVNIAPSAVRVGCVEQTSPNSIIGENGYAYSGYDDGNKTGTGAFKPGGHRMTRTYASINYNFGYIMSEAKINSATFSLSQYRAYSGGATNFGLYRITSGWNFDALTWNSQTGLGHEFVQYQRARTSHGYINWDVREVVNNWVQGVYAQRGFCVKAEDERNMQCEMFENRYSSNPPRLTINWEVPDPVNESYPLSDTTVNLRTVTEHDADNKLAFDGVFADGMATPRAFVSYTLEGKGEGGTAYASRSYKYPDSSSWDKYVPNGTKYKDKLSNWQTHLFANLDFNKEYKVKAIPKLNDATGPARESDSFLVYKATAKDTLPYIASHYGTTLDILSKDNRVQDTLVVGGNTIFVRNPTTTDAYTPKELTDDQKKRIDSALMGRGKHCEYGFEPINMNTGNFILEATDAAVPDVEGDFGLTRTYNAKNDGVESPFGRNWSFAYSESLGQMENGTLVYSAGDGKTLFFDPDGQGGCLSPSGFDLKLIRIPYKKSDLEDDAGEESDAGINAEEDKEGATVGNAIDEGAESTSEDRGGLHDASGDESSVLQGASMETEVGGEDADARSTSAKGALAEEAEGEEEEEPTLYRYELHSPDGSYRGFNAWGMLEEICSAKGLVTKVDYDEPGRLTAITSPTGISYGITVDSRGHIVEVLLPDGNALSYGYDEHGNLTSFTNAMGFTVHYAYDDEWRMISWNDANGTRIIKNSYDEEGRVVEQVDSAGGVSLLEYGDGFTRATNAAGYVTLYFYDDQYRTTHIAYPDGWEIDRAYDSEGNLVSDENGSYVYDEQGNRTSVTVDGHTTIYSYDEKGRLIETTEPDGTITTNGYDDQGNLSWTASNAGAATSFTYDSFGRCLSSIDADGVRELYGWEKGWRTSVTDGLGNTTVYAYDPMGRCISSTDALGNTSRTIYDAAGRITAEQDATGSYSAYELDAVGLLLSVTDPRGYITRFTYDAAYNMSSMTDASGAVTSYSYDIMGHEVSTTSTRGAEGYKTYDKRGRLASLIDEEGGTTTYSYDGRGRLRFMSNPIGGISTAVYDGSLNVPSSYTDAAGSTTEYIYDTRGNAILSKLPDGSTQSAAYGLDGRLLWTQDAVGLKTSYEYSAAGRLKSVNAGGRVYKISYDAAGNPVETVDALGRPTRFSYDPAGRVVAVASADGATVELSYDAAGRQVGVVDALGNAVATAYDPSGNIASVTDPMGAVLVFEHDEIGRLVARTDAEGETASLTYDAAGDVISQADALGNVRKAAYDDEHRLIQATDALGRTISYSYDAAGNLTQRTLPDGSTEKLAYDAAGRLVSSVDARGLEIQYAYDARGNLSDITASNGASESYAYDGEGRLVRATDSLGRNATYEYDLWGSLVAEHAFDGSTVAYSYDAAGQLVSETDALGNATSYRYDVRGNTIEVEKPGGALVSYEYDDANRLTRSTDALGNASAYVYDKAGRAVAETDPDGYTSSFRYDATGQVVEATDGNGNATSYAYDAVGNLVSVTRPEGGIERYLYDAEGQLIKHSTPRGSTEQFGYDALGNVSEYINPLGAVTLYEHDSSGGLTREVDAVGNATSYEYDAAGNMVKMTKPNGADWSFDYDLLGRMTAIVSPRGYTRSFDYGIGDTVARESDNAGRSSTYAYDAVGRMVEARNNLGATAWSYDCRGNAVRTVDATGAITERAFDAEDRLVEEVDAAGAVSRWLYDGRSNVVEASRGYSVERYAYDGASNMVSAIDGNGNKTAFSYDKENRLSQTIDALGAVSSFSYDLDGNLASATDAKGGTALFSYDDAGNLVGHTDRVGRSTSYAYDAVGRLASLVTPEGNKTEYSYDALGNVSEIIDGLGHRTAYAYDEEGNMTSIESPSGAVEKMEYDLAGRLVAATDPAGALSRYDYDELGNLIEKAYSADEEAGVLYSFDSEGRTVSRSDRAGDAVFERDGLGRVIREVDGQGRALSYAYDSLGNVSRVEYPDGSTVEYGYDNAGNLVTVSAPEGEYRYSYDASSRPVGLSRPNGTVTAYAYDEMGNVVSVSTSDSTGSLLSSYAYSHDEEGAIVSEAETIVDGAGTQHRADRAFAYDGDGRLVSCSQQGSEGCYAEVYTYDAVGNRLSLERTGDNADSVAYEYDDDNRLVRSASSVDGVTDYSYDVAGQLIAKKGDGRAEHAYSYGVEGRLEAVRSGGRLLMAATYDGDGNRVMQVSRCHSREKGTKSGEASEGDDDEGGDEAWAQASALDLFWYGVVAGSAAALSAASPATIGAAVELACHEVEQGWASNALRPGYARYALDALAGIGSTGEELVTAAAELGVIPQAFDYTAEGYDIVSYVNSTVTQLPQVMASYSSRSGVSDEVYGRDRLSKSSRGAASFFANDGRGSVSQTLSTSGSVNSWHIYGPFGNQQAGSSQGELPAYGFNGEEAHPQTGLQYLRARYYDVSTARFGVQDSYLGATGDPLSLNRYLYGASDPVNHIDPTGHFNLWGAVTSFAKGVANTVKAAARAVVSAVKTVASVVVGAVKAVCNFFAGAARSAATYARNTYNTVTQAAYHGYQSFTAWAEAKAAEAQAAIEAFSCGTAKFIGSVAEAAQSIQLPSLSELGHTALDVLGFVPVVGAVADVANGVWYLAEGDYGNAAMSFVSAVPGVGDAAAAAKMGVKAAEAAYDVASAASKVSKAADAATTTTKVADAGTGAVKATPPASTSSKASSAASSGGGGARAPTPAPAKPSVPAPAPPKPAPSYDVVEIAISKNKYPESAQHIEDAIASGHPDVLTIEREGAKENRKLAQEGVAKVEGKDLDEYPPAMFAEGGKGASVRPIDPSDNRGAGASMGNQLRGYPDGTHVKIEIVD